MIPTEPPRPPEDDATRLSAEDEATRLAGGPSAVPDPDATRAAAPADSSAPGASGPRPGAPSIPGFRIVGKLGEGGMGIVYAADQESPRRRVALKVVRGGPIADELLIRLFQREADMLARLHHPNIAAIHASGRTEDGHHWFAMELVEGETLGDWARRQAGPPGAPRTAETLRERLEVFRTICDAVQYAHQRGVIHRDLKPSNLVVLPPAEDASSTGSAPSHARSARPLVKVLDFGLARLTEPEPDAATMASSAGAVRGTLPYMSPEQVIGDVDAIDVRTDIYALGVILHELLVDRRPYEVPPRLLDAIRTIRETDPPPLATHWPGPGRADADLETIVRKALAKELDGRYGSAGDLSEDLRRWLANEPILARPPSTAYQIRKLVARHRAPVAAAAAGLVLVVGAAVGMAFLWARSEKNLGRALRAETTAVEEAGTARRTTDFLIDLFALSGPERARGEDVTAREILDRGAERLRHELADEPVVRARLLGTIGRVYYEMGLARDARPLAEESVTILQSELGESSGDLATRRRQLADLLENLGEFEAADSLYVMARDYWEAAGDTLNGEYAAALSLHGWMLGQLFRNAEALPLVERAVAINEAIPDREPREIAMALSHLGAVLQNLGRLDEAKAVLERALGMERGLAGGAPSAAVADVLTNLGGVEQSMGRLDLALPHMEEALAIRSKVLEPGTQEILDATGNLAITYAMLGRLGEARPLMERQVQDMEGVYGPDHPNLGQALYNLGYLLIEMGDPAAAREPLERALAIRSESIGPRTGAVSMVLYSLASVEEAAGNPQKARRLLEDVVDIDSEELGPDDPEVASDLETLVALLRRMGDEPAAAVAEARRQAIVAKIEAAAAAGG